MRAAAEVGSVAAVLACLEDEEGSVEEVEYEPYRGEAELRKLWDEVVGLCAEEDVARLEEEVKGKAPEERLQRPARHPNRPNNLVVIILVAFHPWTRYTGSQR